MPWKTREEFLGELPSSVACWPCCDETERNDDCRGSCPLKARTEVTSKLYL